MSRYLDMKFGLLYIRAEMTFDERRTWIEAVVTAVVTGWYFLSVLPQASSTPVADIEYQWLLGISVVVVIATTIGGIIATNIVALVANEVAGARGDATHLETSAAMAALDRSDERDAAIGRFGAQVGGAVLALAALVPLALAMAEREQFWIANSLYAALVLSSLVASAVKLVAYRRGF
jgi:hypothetical protein